MPSAQVRPRAWLPGGVQLTQEYNYPGNVTISHHHCHQPHPGCQVTSLQHFPEWLLWPGYF
jgi:hypothetical protein